MVGYKAFLTSRTILSGNKHASILLKFIQHQQIFLRTSSQQERGFDALFTHLSTHIEQRRHTDTTTNKQHFLPRDSRGETVTKRQDTVQNSTRLKCSQCFSAFTNSCYEQPELILGTIYVINGNRTTQECGRGTINAHLHKLPWQHSRERFSICQANQHITCMNTLNRCYRQV